MLDLLRRPVRLPSGGGDVLLRGAERADLPVVIAPPADDPSQRAAEARRTDARRSSERLGFLPPHVGFALRVPRRPPSTC